MTDLQTQPSDRPSDEQYEFACILKELLDTYELLHVMPPAPDLDYDQVRASLDAQRQQLRTHVDTILVRYMGEGILQPQLRTKRPRLKR